MSLCCSFDNGSRAIALAVAMGGQYNGNGKNGGLRANMNLDELRTALSDLDGQLVELVARRQALSEQVAAVKRATGRATRDFGREREVILRGRNTASRLGVSPDLAESLLRQLILSSLATQEQARVAAQAHGSGKRALVIGGHGKMGGWFAEFLASQGFGSPSPTPAVPRRAS